MPDVYYDTNAVAGANNGTTKADAYLTKAAALAGSGAGDKIFQSHLSSEVVGTITFTVGGQVMVSVDFGGSTPPVAADYLPGGLIHNTGAMSFTGGNSFLTFGSFYSGANDFRISTSDTIIVMSEGEQQFGNSSKQIQLLEGVFVFKDMDFVLIETSNNFDFTDSKAMLIVQGGVFSGSNLLYILTNFGRGGYALFEGVDFQLDVTTALVNANANDGVTTAIFKGCNMPSNLGVKPVYSGTMRRGSLIGIYGSSISNQTYFMQEEHAEGTIITETTNVKTGGASDGITPISWKFVTNTKTVKYGLPLKGRIPILFYAATVGAQNFTVDIMNDGTTFNDDEVWIEIQSPSATILRNIGDTRPANLLTVPTPIPLSGAAWDETGIAAAVKQLLTIAVNVGQVGWVEAYICVGAPSEVLYADVKILDGDRQYLAGQAYINEPAVAVPDPAAEVDVRLGTVYDNGVLTGSLAVPAVGNVREGVAVDNTVGTYEPALEANVQEAVQYGEDGTEFTGTLTTPIVVQQYPFEIIELDTNIVEVIEL